MSDAAAEIPSFDRVFAEHVDYVWRVLAHLGVPDADRDDLAQEVFLVVHRRLPQFEARASIRSWLWAIAWRIAKSHARRTRRSPLSLDPAAQERQVSPQPSPERRAADQQSMRTLDDALASLDAGQRSVFLLHELEGLPMRAITESMGCPLQTGYSRLRLAKDKVRLAFAEAGHAGA